MNWEEVRKLLSQKCQSEGIKPSDFRSQLSGPEERWRVGALCAGGRGRSPVMPTMRRDPGHVKPE